jgi:predicted Zn-dependent protease with MMP-like domain
MVGIAQLVERLVVVQEVAGSSPVTHPTFVSVAPPRHTVRVLEVGKDEFERLVVRALDDLPDEMVDGLDNVVFVVEDAPESEEILGLYDGVALTERGNYGFGELPDRIVIYRLPLLEHCATLDELGDEIHITLVHEIAHFYGINDDRLHDLGWA